jgi:4'-phosphopantetheinyl transferase
MAEALADNEAHIWCARPDELGAADAAAQARALLSDDERQRHERFIFARDRQLFLTAHALVRRVLSRYEPVAPGDWRFAPNQHGRPEIVGRASALRFNLSHTHGLAVCAVARVEVGVDVERHRDAPLDVAQRFFAPVELAALNALPPAQQSRRFFDYWTLKESYLKARGIGMTVPLAKFWFLVDDAEPPHIVIDPSLGDDAARWQFRQCQPTKEHLVSLCLLRAGAGEVSLGLRWLSLS